MCIKLHVTMATHAVIKGKSTDLSANCRMKKRSGGRTLVLPPTVTLTPGHLQKPLMAGLLEGCWVVETGSR